MALMASSTVATTSEAAQPVVDTMPQAVSTIAGVPSEALPQSGQCRIFFDHVAADKQPAGMECGHALWLARNWGGRVVAVKGLQAAVLDDFDGRNDFAGVPSDALPPAGYCRAWIDGLAAEQQPQATDCVAARHLASERGGRVLFMPL